MRMRLGAPLLVAVAGLLGAVQPAAASHCGAAVRELSAAVLRRPVLLQRLPAAVQDLLQAGVRHRPGEAVAHLLPDRPGNRHEAGLQDLLPRRVQDLLQDRATRPATRPVSRPAASECE